MKLLAHSRDIHLLVASDCAYKIEQRSLPLVTVTMDKATPRINAGMRQRFIGNTVRMVGKVVKINGNMAIIEASDQTQVQVTLNQACNAKVCMFF